MSCKKKKYDLFDETMKIGKISAGSMVAGALPGMMSSGLPGTQETADKISSVAGKTLPMLPRIQGMRSAFGSMSMLQEVEKKAKRRR